MNPQEDKHFVAEKPLSLRATEGRTVAERGSNELADHKLLGMHFLLPRATLNKRLSTVGPWDFPDKITLRRTYSQIDKAITDNMATMNITRLLRARGKQPACNLGRRKSVNAIFCIMRSGSAWRLLPKDF